MIVRSAPSRSRFFVFCIVTRVTKLRSRMDLAAGLLELNTSGFYYTRTDSSSRKFAGYNVEVDTIVHEAEVTKTVESEEEDEEVCWICLGSSTLEAELLNPCSCPRKVHQDCLAQWQMMQCGRSEESQCRFCQSTLPSWEVALDNKPKAAPLMTVSHDGQTHVLEVAPGEEGRQAFERRIREIFGLGEKENVSVTFGIKEPFSGSDVTLDGWSAWSAAVVCASCSAASRMIPPARRSLGDIDVPTSSAERTARSARPNSSSPEQAEGNCLSSWLAFRRWRRTI